MPGRVWYVMLCQLAPRKGATKNSEEKIRSTEHLTPTLYLHLYQCEHVWCAHFCWSLYMWTGKCSVPMINVFNASSDCYSAQEAFSNLTQQLFHVKVWNLFSFFFFYNLPDCMHGRNQTVPSQLNVVSKIYIYILTNLTPAIGVHWHWISCYLN